MISYLVRTGARARVLVVILTLAAAAFAGFQMTRTSIEAVPEFAPVTVEVQSEALGLSAQEVEDLVTVPLESNLLSGVAWVDTMQSISMAGLSSIVMTFEDGTDEIRARQVVQERLTQGALLTNASKAPVMLQPTSAANRVMMIGLSSADQSLVDLSVLSRWTIRPKLMSVEGVANVSVWGMRDRQLHVQADPVRMQQHGVSLDQVVATTGNALWVSPLSFLEASTPGRGGFLDLPQQRVNVQHVSPITDSATLGRVSVEGAASPDITLADVATIVEAPPTIIGDGIVDDTSNLMLVVEKQKGVSTAAVSQGIEEALASLRPGLPGVVLDSSVYRPAEYADDTRRNLGITALIVLALIAIGSVLVYRAWRPVVIIVASVSMSLLVGWLVLWQRDTPINVLTLTGLGAGAALAIAQSVAAVDALSRAPDDGTAAKRLVAAYAAVGRSAAYTTLAAAFIAVPVHLWGGQSGAFLSEAVDGFLLAVIACLVVALLVGPGIAAALGSARLKDVGSAHLPTKAPSLALSAVAVVAVLAVGAAGAIALGLSAQDRTRPSFQEGVLVLTATAQEGTSPLSLTSTLGTLATSIRGLDGVATVGGHVGRAVSGERVVGSNTGELWVTLAAGADQDTVAARVLDAARQVDGLTSTIGTNLDHRIDRILPAAAAPLVVSVYGPVPSTLEEAAASTLEVVTSTSGVSNAALVQTPTEQTLQVTVDLAKVEALGMTPGDVRRQAATLVGGLEVGAIFQEQKVFDVQVWTAEDLRNSLEKVRALPIDTPGGVHVPLGDVASVTEGERPTIIRRESVQRRLDIVADIADAATRDAVASRLAAMTLPAEYHAEVRPESAGVEESERLALLAGLGALVGLLLLIQAATRNWWYAAAATTAIPVGMIGGLIATHLLGGLTLGAFLGLATLSVLGVHQALIAAQGMRPGAHTPRLSIVRAVLPAAVLILLMGIGLLVLGAGPGREALWDLGAVLAGGAITSSLTTLVVLPAVAARWADREESADDYAIDEHALGSHSVTSYA